MPCSALSIASACEAVVPTSSAESVACGCISSGSKYPARIKRANDRSSEASSSAYGVGVELVLVLVVVIALVMLVVVALGVAVVLIVTMLCCFRAIQLLTMQHGGELLVRLLRARHV
jgi:hypothetical protein